MALRTIRKPRHRDIVAVKANGPHPIYGPIDGYIWRYYVRDGRTCLRKDNSYYREEQPATREEITGVIRMADVTGNLPTQQIAPGEFAELVAAIRAGAVYVNIHSTPSPAGEIRGQLF